MQFPNENHLQALRERYLAGTKIRLNHMDDPYAPIPDGTVGEVAPFRFLPHMARFCAIYDKA